MEADELRGNARSIEGDTRPKCSKCKNYKLVPADPVLLFASPKHLCLKAIDLVTSEMTETDCYAMRHIRSECGPDAKLFEEASAKDETPTAEAPVAPVGPGIGRELKDLSAAVALLVLLALVAFWVSQYELNQSRVIRTGEVTLREGSAKDGSRRVTARTRLLAIGKRQVWQFEASPGDWRDCGDDCEKALRKALGK